MSKENLSPDLVRAVTRFAKRLRARHAIDRRTAEQFARVLRATLIPRRKPGRKPTRRVLTAVRIRADGVAWPEIYKTLIDGFAALHPCDRIHQTRKLRRAVAAFLKRRSHRLRNFSGPAFRSAPHV